jgi:hypothetical protein
VSAHPNIAVLQEATRAVVDTCAMHMGLALTVEANPGDPRAADVQYGSSIELTADNGSSWHLAVMGDRESCQKLTRILFAMEAHEEPTLGDLADGIGGIASVAVGVFRSGRVAAGQQVQNGLPRFLRGRNCAEFFGPDLEGLSQSLSGPDGIRLHVVIVWQEGALLPSPYAPARRSSPR